MRQPDGSSYWDIPGPVLRGKDIEDAIADVPPYSTGFQTPDGFRGIDFVTEGGVPVSLMSVDLTTANRLNRTNEVFRTMRNKIDDLFVKFIDQMNRDGFVDSAGQRIDADDVDLTQARVDFVVPKGSATEFQVEQIERAMDYARSRGIEIRIIEIE